MMAARELACDVGIQPACHALGVSRASFYRKRRTRLTVGPDVTATTAAVRRTPRALDASERQAVCDLLHSERFRDRAPAAVYAQLLDENRYLCSIRTMYRLLHDNAEVRERRDQLRHPQYHKPELLATAPNQVWSWDITKLLGPAKWTYFYLYVILDIFSRYVVGWMVAHRESADLASRLIQETSTKYDIDVGQLTLHSDRGAAMQSHSVAQLLATLGVIKSFSRPQVSNDNPFSESQFKTLKYRPEFPDRFQSFDEAHAFCKQFFPWYNDQHYHSGLALLTPATVHFGRAAEVQAQRQQTLNAAYALHPERFPQGRPSHLPTPQQVWINPPVNQPQSAHQPAPASCHPIPANGLAGVPAQQNAPPGSGLTHPDSPVRPIAPTVLGLRHEEPTLGQQAESITQQPTTHIPVH
jgi:putative transposase